MTAPTYTTEHAHTQTHTKRKREAECVYLDRLLLGCKNSNDMPDNKPFRIFSTAVWVCTCSQTNFYPRTNTVGGDVVEKSELHLWLNFTSLKNV